MEPNAIYVGDCMDLLKEVSDDSIDLIATDPPYGLKFMGKDWDKAVPPVGVWKQCLRVLKPGAFAFVMCIPRQDCLSRMIVNLEDAGFVASFSPLYHTFATGFPKASNMGKLADRRLGASREVVGKYVCPDGRTRNRMGGQMLPNSPLAGTIPDITVPASPEAKVLDGSYAGWQPKPAVEVVLVAMCPLSEKTYVDQAMANGKGVTWLGDGRIPFESQKDAHVAANKNRHFDFGSGARDNKIYRADTRSRAEQGNYDFTKGRFPANLLVSDDVLNDGTITKGVKSFVKRAANVRMGGDKYGEYPSPIDTPCYPDSGSFSRYFSLDAWWTERVKRLPEQVQKTFPFMIVPKPSKSEKNKGLDALPEKQMYKCDGSGQSLEIFGTTDGGRQPRQNIHPTVKAVRLMSYLITIGSREGDTVLDPYCGTATTGVAAAILNRQFIGFEFSEEYAPIAHLRYQAAIREIEAEKEESSRQLDWIENLSDDTREG